MVAVAIGAQVLVPPVVHAVDLVVHRHMAHSTVAVHFIQLAALVVVLDHAVVFRSEFGPLHVWVMQAVLVVISTIVVRVVPANVARARTSMLPGTVYVSASAIDSELDLSFVPRLAHSSFGSDCWKSHLVLHLVEDEEGDSPLVGVLVPDRSLAQLVLVRFIEHDLHDSLVELYVFFLHAYDVKKLIFARVVLLCQLLDLLVCFLVLTPECLVYLSESFNLGCLLAHICIFGVALIKIVS